MRIPGHRILQADMVYFGYVTSQIDKQRGVPDWLKLGWNELEKELIENQTKEAFTRNLDGKVIYLFACNKLIVETKLLIYWKFLREQNYVPIHMYSQTYTEQKTTCYELKSQTKLYPKKVMEHVDTIFDLYLQYHTSYITAFADLIQVISTN